MLVGVASLPPSLNPTLWNIGILDYKQAKLRKHLQHGVHAHSRGNSCILMYSRSNNR